MIIEIQPVGYVKNSRIEITDDQWGDVVSEIELTGEFTDESLKGIEGFSHCEILFYFDKADKDKVTAGSRHPRNNHDMPLTGIFAQRAKDRPNRLGVSFAEILGHNGNVLTVKGLDAVNGTPVIDIKPVFKEFLPFGDIIQPMWVSRLLKDYWK